MGHDIDIIEEIAQPLRSATLKHIIDSLRAPQAYHATTNNCKIFLTACSVEAPSARDSAALCSSRPSLR